MPTVSANGAELYYQRRGAGEPMVLVHGSWTDHHDWDLVFTGLSQRFDVLCYDRRGHSNSPPGPGPGSLGEDAEDLAALVEALEMAPAHIVGHSYGGVIVLRLATRRPDLFLSMAIHEAPAFNSLEHDPQVGEQARRARTQLEPVVQSLVSGDYEAGARHFVDGIIFGPDTWDTRMTLPLKRKFIQNAPTFLDEIRDPDRLVLDLEALGRFDRPAFISYGGRSKNLFPHITRRLAEVLPRATTHVFEQAAHVPQVSSPDEFIRVVSAFVEQSRAAAGGPAPA